MFGMTPRPGQVDPAQLETRFRRFGQLWDETQQPLAQQGILTLQPADLILDGIARHDELYQSPSFTKSLHPAGEAIALPILTHACTHGFCSTVPGLGAIVDTRHPEANPVPIQSYH